MPALRGGLLQRGKLLGWAAISLGCAQCGEHFARWLARFQLEQGLGEFLP